MRKPTSEDLQAAYGQPMADIIGPNLKILFCGINPSIYSAAVCHHFARPGNRFWKTLYGAGLTPRLLTPAEDRELLKFGYGLTNIAAPATARADELSQEDLRQGYLTLAQKIQQYRPKCLAVLGISAYRTAFKQPRARVGPQEPLHGTLVWALPNPSGLNAHYQLDGLQRVYRELLDAVGDKG
nr:G/U mismatch-specific DNA glycosylase [Romeria gracilis]